MWQTSAATPPMDAIDCNYRMLFPHATQRVRTPLPPPPQPFDDIGIMGMRTSSATNSGYQVHPSEHRYSDNLANATAYGSPIYLPDPIPTQENKCMAPDISPARQHGDNIPSESTLQAFFTAYNHAATYAGAELLDERTFLENIAEYVASAECQEWFSNSPACLVANPPTHDAATGPSTCHVTAIVETPSIANKNDTYDASIAQRQPDAASWPATEYPSPFPSIFPVPEEKWQGKHNTTASTRREDRRSRRPGPYDTLTQRHFQCTSQASHPPIRSSTVYPTPSFPSASTSHYPIDPNEPENGHRWGDQHQNSSVEERPIHFNKAFANAFAHRANVVEEPACGNVAQFSSTEIGRVSSPSIVFHPADTTANLMFHTAEGIADPSRFQGGWSGYIEGPSSEAVQLLALSSMGTQRSTSSCSSSETQYDCGSFWSMSPSTSSSTTSIETCAGSSTSPSYLPPTSRMQSPQPPPVLPIPSAVIPSPAYPENWHSPAYLSLTFGGGTVTCQVLSGSGRNGRLDSTGNEIPGIVSAFECGAAFADVGLFEEHLKRVHDFSTNKATKSACKCAWSGCDGSHTRPGGYWRHVVEQHAGAKYKCPVVNCKHKVGRIDAMETHLRGEHECRPNDFRTAGTKNYRFFV